MLREVIDSLLSMNSEYSRRIEQLGENLKIHWYIPYVLSSQIHQYLMNETPLKKSRFSPSRIVVNSASVKIEK